MGDADAAEVQRDRQRAEPADHVRVQRGAFVHLREEGSVVAEHAESLAVVDHGSHGLDDTYLLPAAVDKVADED